MDRGRPIRSICVGPPARSDASYLNQDCDPPGRGCSSDVPGDPSRATDSSPRTALFAARCVDRWGLRSSGRRQVGDPADGRQGGGQDERWSACGACSRFPARRVPWFETPPRPAGVADRRSAIRCCSRRPQAEAVKRDAAAVVRRGRSRAPPSVKPSHESADKAFGNPAASIIEKLIENGRHIEFQILVRRRSVRALHLGERECSIQRQHQKLTRGGSFAGHRRRDAVASGSENGGGAGRRGLRAIAMRGRSSSSATAEGRRSISWR